MIKQALLVTDILTGIFQLDEDLYRPDAFFANVEALIHQARLDGTSIIYIHHVGPPGSPFAPSAPGSAIHLRIAPQADDLIVEKSHPDAFQSSRLEALLRERGIEELMVCGFATEGCIDSTVRSAYAKGFAVILIADAHTTTRNPVLDAAQIVAHHNYVLSRFARV